MNPLERHELHTMVDHMQTIVDRLDTMLERMEETLCGCTKFYMCGPCRFPTKRGLAGLEFPDPKRTPEQEAEVIAKYPWTKVLFNFIAGGDPYPEDQEILDDLEMRAFVKDTVNNRHFDEEE